MPMNYLKSAMYQLSNILYNTSQNNLPYNSKDKILDSIKAILKNYNDSVSEEHKVNWQDFREINSIKDK